MGWTTVRTLVLYLPAATPLRRTGTWLTVEREGFPFSETEARGVIEEGAGVQWAGENTCALPSCSHSLERGCELGSIGGGSLPAWQGKI